MRVTLFPTNIKELIQKVLLGLKISLHQFPKSESKYSS
jgi:hypothetical protein